jgi:hypothetical protein
MNATAWKTLTNKHDRWAKHNDSQMRKDERKSSNEAMIEFTNAHNFISVLPFFGGAQRVQAVAAIGVRRSHRLAHEYDSLPRILGLSGLLDEE